MSPRALKGWCPLFFFVISCHIILQDCYLAISLILVRTPRCPIECNLTDSLQQLLGHVLRAFLDLLNPVILYWSDVIVCLARHLYLVFRQNNAGTR
jgi:hypothetical protein